MLIADTSTVLFVILSKIQKLENALTPLFIPVINDKIADLPIPFLRIQRQQTKGFLPDREIRLHNICNHVFFIFCHIDNCGRKMPLHGNCATHIQGHDGILAIVKHRLDIFLFCSVMHPGVHGAFKEILLCKLFFCQIMMLAALRASAYKSTTMGLLSSSVVVVAFALSLLVVGDMYDISFFKDISLALVLFGFIGTVAFAVTQGGDD